MKQYILTILLFMGIICQVASKTNITNTYMTNAGLNSLTGWSYGDNGYNYTDWKTDGDVPVIEFYHTWGTNAGAAIGTTKNFHFTQTVTLPAGYYRLAVNAFYREGNGNGKNTKAYIFAGNKQQYIIGLGASGVAAYTGSNDLYKAANAFSLGDFSNEFDFHLDSEQSIEIGFRGYIDTYCSWCILGPITLYEYNAEDYMDDLVAKCNMVSDYEGQIPGGAYSNLQTAVTNKRNASYSSAGEVLQAIDDVAELYSQAELLKEPYDKYKTFRNTLLQLADNNIYKYTDPGSAKTTFDSAISAANTAVEAATTASAIDTQTANIRAATMTFISSVTAEDGNPFNLTFLASTAAADWQTASGLNPAATAPTWSVPKPDPSMADFVESYTEASGGESITGNILYQTINDMPAGYYTVALYAAASYTPNRGSLVEKCADGQPNITFGFAGDNSLSLPVAHRTSLTAADQVPVNLSVQLSDAGALTFGIKKTAAGSNWHVAQIYTITYSKDPDLTILKADRDALVSEAEGVLASTDASLLTTGQQNALSSAISTANAANTFDELTTVTLTSLPNAIQTARQQIQTVKDNRVLMIAALERFENDYNLADGTDYRRSTMSAAAWTDLLAKVNAVSTALDDVSQAANYGTLKDNLVNQMDATDVSLRLFKSYKAMVDGTTALSIAGDYGADSNMDTDDTQQTAISALNENFDNYAATQSSNFDVSAFLGANLDFSAAEGLALNTENSNNIHEVTGWEVSYADADTWAVIQTHQKDNDGKLYMRKNWGSSATTMTVTKQKMLPVGKYRLSLSWNSDKANMTNLSAYKINETSTTIGGDGAETLTYDFEVTDAAAPFDLTFGFQKTGTGNTPAQIVADDITLTYMPNIITLYDKGSDADNNSTTIESNNGKRGVITLHGRTLYKDNSWNTICLPFDTDLTGDLAGATLMELDTEGSYNGHATGLEGTTLHLYFKDATSIRAGVPYLIKWESGDNITNPSFTGVTISNDTPDGIASTDDGSVTFQGIYTPTPLDKDDKSNLYLAADNTLDWPNVDDFKVNAFRAYFKISESAANNVRSFVLRFGNDDITSINIEKGVNGMTGDGFYYTINGQRLNGKPTTPGVYIHNGKKVVIE